MHWYSRLCVLLALFVAQTYALLSDTLVLTDNKVEYSHFLDTLESIESSYTVSNVGSETETQLLDVNDQILYKNLIILPLSTKKISSNIDFNTLLKYSENGGNVIVISDSNGTQLDITIFLNQLGIYPSPKDYQFIDYHNDNKLEISNTNALNHYVINDPFNIDDITNASIALLSNSPYLLPLYQCSPTSFTKDSNNNVWHSGNQGYLAASFQGLNNARISWFGTSIPFVDATFNENLSKDVITWTLQLRSILKITKFSHKRVDADLNELPFVDEDDYYKVKDYSYFEIGVSEYNHNSKSWIPYITQGDDALQLEFSMLDPYQRLNLNISSKSDMDSIYSAFFQIPDQHGMFKFKVDYKREGLTYLVMEDIVPVRHLANDEFQRSWEIPNSSVYLAGYGVVTIGWLFFVVIFILSSGKNVDNEKKNI